VANLEGFFETSKSFFQEVFFAASVVSESECKGSGMFWICKGWRGRFFVGRGYGCECQGVGRVVNLG
ncbi:MAG: hypothetical protein SOY07_03730, partial [Bacteroidales bacterium]|nr:hypothetical protein [Bacteroidales bacterium]